MQKSKSYLIWKINYFCNILNEYEFTCNNVSIFHGANPPIVNPYLFLSTEVLNRIRALKTVLSLMLILRLSKWFNSFWVSLESFSRKKQFKIKLINCRIWNGILNSKISLTRLGLPDVPVQPGLSRIGSSVPGCVPDEKN